jgi:hypothetical protein
MSDPSKTVHPQPEVGTCWRHRDGFWDGTDRLRLRADGLCEIVYSVGSVAEADRAWPLHEVLEIAREGRWVQVPDAPAAAKGGVA